MKRFVLTIFFSLAFVFVGPFAEISNASRADELRQKIDEKNATIKQLEKEIESYKKQVEAAGKEAKTLQSAVKTLDLTQAKLSKDISLTQNKISGSELEIERLSLSIGDKESDINKLRGAIKESLQDLYAGDSATVIETLLEYDSLSIYWDEIDSQRRFQSRLKSHTDELEKIRTELEDTKSITEKKKAELVSYKAQLADQRALVELNKKEKNRLLSETKNKETNYKKALAMKITIRDAFEKELQEFESALRFEIDPSRLPPAGKGVLAWPLDDIRITQYFGNTAFAAAHQALYSGIGHNGVDFAAPLGTLVKASANGVVDGFGDTDIVCPGASYGKWVLVRHNNGLSTLYAHLSLIKASVGQQISRGDILGYSGNTGYSTGPHLHYTVYATQGVKIMDRKSKVCGGTYTMPVADLKAYLNPLIYL